MAATVASQFDELQVKFGIDAKTRAWLTAEEGLNASSIMDFLHAAASETDVQKMVEAAQADNVFLATSRLRQAWLSLRKAEEEVASIKRRGLDETDLDTLLAQPVLDDIAARHWARYKQTWPPELAPADLLVSRISREISKRMLSVKEVFKVRTQAHQLRASRKRTRVGEGIEVAIGESEDTEAVRSVHSYLQLHLTLMLAYSMAGCRARTGAPLQEPRGSDSTAFVEVPLDTVMRYHYRLQDRAGRLHQGALAWLATHDEQDRAAWVDKFRNSEESLGTIIAACIATREAMWEVPRQLEHSGGKGSGKLQLLPPPPPPHQGTALQQGQQQQQATWATKLKDGTPLCLAFQRGKCRADNCMYAHKCAVIGENGGVCGARHSASQHRSRRKAAEELHSGVERSQFCSDEGSAPQRPAAADPFSGPRAPVGATLAWCGQEIIAIDILIEPRVKLAGSQFQQACSGKLVGVDTAVWAPDCSTFTRAREGTPPATATH